MNYIDKGEVWLYRFVDGEVKEYHGNVRCLENYRQWTSSCSKGGFIFESDDSVNKWNVAIDEGIVLLNSVWLRKQERKKAIEALHAYKYLRFMKVLKELYKCNGALDKLRAAYEQED